MSISTTTGDDVQYFVWTTLEHSLIKWVTVKQSLLMKESDNNENLMGLFAEKRFKKKEIIGVYLGKFEKETEIHESNYAYQIGNIDAVKGLGGKPYMGMHFMK
jgi:hypothetical protein